MMRNILYGRRCLTFSKGCAVYTSTVWTVRALPGEDEQAFTRRLLTECGESEGTLEIVFRAGVPDYATITVIPDLPGGEI
jgi:hypothetical protein